jgi:myosin heavy subunit
MQFHPPQRVFASFLLLVAMFTVARSQELAATKDSLAPLIQTLEQKISRKKSLEKQRDRWLQRLEQKSAEITQQKKKRPRNPLQARQLEHLLQETQQLSAELQKLQSRLRRLDDSIQVVARTLVRQIDKELIASFRHFRTARKASPAYRQALQQIGRLYQLRMSYQGYAGPSFHLARLLPVHFDSLDTPEDRKRKRSILQDQLDYLHSLETALQEKERQAREWARLYRLSGNLLKDLQFQEIQDEAMAKTDEMIAPNRWRQPESGRTLSFQTPDQTASGLSVGWPHLTTPDFSTLPAHAGYILALPPDKLPRQLPEIQKLIRRVRALADSLQLLISRSDPQN